MLESKIQSKILKTLKELGIYAYKNITTNRKGIPDIICCIDGKFVALEVKQAKGKTTDLQDYNIKMIRESGGVAEVVRSVADALEVIKKIQKDKYVN